MSVSYDDRPQTQVPEEKSIQTTTDADAYPEADDEGGYPQTVSLAALEALHSDTPEAEIHYRVARDKGGRPVMKDGQPLMLGYVTARYVQDRLDEVVGPHNWQSTFMDLQTGAVRCGIGIRWDGAWVWKWDVGIPSNIEPDKGAHSDAFKRAGVQWGIARDLYDERDADEPGTVAVATPAETVQQQVTAGPPAQQQAPLIIDAGTLAPPQPQQVAVAPSTIEPAKWMCPIHGDTAKIVPAGVSRRTGRKYNAFLACSIAGCDEKGPSIR